MTDPAGEGGRLLHDAYGRVYGAWMDRHETCIHGTDHLSRCDQCMEQAERVRMHDELIEAMTELRIALQAMTAQLQGDITS